MFEESKGIMNETDGFVEYPKCYRTIDEEPIETLFLEDMSVRGFSIINRYTQEVTADHAYLVMKALAKLHAISFALKWGISFALILLFIFKVNLIQILICT